VSPKKAFTVSLERKTTVPENPGERLLDDKDKKTPSARVRNSRTSSGAPIDPHGTFIWEEEGLREWESLFKGAKEWTRINRLCLSPSLRLKRGL